MPSHPKVLRRSRQGNKRRQSRKSRTDLYYPRHLALLEDSPVERQLIRERLEGEQFDVITPLRRTECLELLSGGCRIFLLDVNMGGGKRKVEGLQTLEEIKQQCPEAFCAIISGDSRHFEVATRLHADWTGRKSDEEIDRLTARLNDLYLARRLALRSDKKITKRDVGCKLRAESAENTKNAVEPPIDAYLTTIMATLGGPFGSIEGKIGEENLVGATRDLVLLEAALRELLKFGRHFGDGFGIVIRALWNSVLQHPGQELTSCQWAVWRRILEQVVAERVVSISNACLLANELEKVGFNTEPPSWPQITELLEESGHAGIS